MAISAADSTIYAGLLGCPATTALLDDAAEIAAMIEVEAALARVQGRLGIIPPAAAARIDLVLGTVTVDPSVFTAATARDGVPTTALVAALREAVGGDAGRYLHWGATSQDIVDTGLVLRLRRLIEELDPRIERIANRLAESALEHRRTVVIARTRSQQATPTTLGLKLAGWLAPLGRHRARLAELRPRLLVVQLGGAAGNLAALGSLGAQTADALADELGLGRAAMPWHTQRDGLVEFTGWLSLVTGSLGKFGQDLILLGQTEIGEVSAGDGGGSSTMPHKSNPVRAEMLVTLARLNGSLIGAMHQAAIQEHERGGPGWTLEWMTLGQMAAATGAALGHAQALADTLGLRPDRVRDALAISGGLILAEAATFALAAHLPRPRAQAIVKRACTRAVAEGRHLVDVLAEDTDAPVDWNAVRDPAGYLGCAEVFVDRVLAALEADH